MTETPYQCPNCAGYTQRIHRRYVDRLMSVVVPVKRYKCHDYHCGWKGNVRINRHKSAITPIYK